MWITRKMQSMNLSENLKVEMCRRGNVKINLSFCLTSWRKWPSTGWRSWWNHNILTNVPNRGSRSCYIICCRGKTRFQTENAAWCPLSNRIHSPPHSLIRSAFYIMLVLLLRKADIRFKVCSEEKWHRTHLANSWRPSSRRWDVPDSFAPSDTMRKWRSLNMVTWSSLWGWVTCSSSRQRSFTHTPATQSNTSTFSEVGFSPKVKNCSDVSLIILTSGT